MHISVNGNDTYASTGGRDHVAERPFLIFIHGSGQNHLSWTQQSRSFAYGGYNVLAPDFPGHGHSAGAALTTIEAMADWIIALMDVANADQAIVVGHSQGCLIALELAARYPVRIKKAVFIAGAAAIPVNEALVSMAEATEPKAIAAMVAWGFGSYAHKFDSTVPGASLIGAGVQLMGQNDCGALAADLNACNTYVQGPDAAAQIKCPTLCILAEKDKMTPLKNGLKLADSLKGARVEIIKGAGHMLPPEKPREVNVALRGFLNK